MSVVRAFPHKPSRRTVGDGKGGMMKRLLCYVLGHQKVPAALSRNRFSCRRCGVYLGRDVPTMPMSADVMVMRRVLHGAGASIHLPQRGIATGIDGLARSGARPH